MSSKKSSSLNKNTFRKNISKANIFCKKCNNLLITSIAKNTNELQFFCNLCKQPYNANKDDSLRYMSSKGSEISSIYNNLIEHADEDPVTPKIYANCPKCKYNIAKQVRLGKEMKILHICIKCKHKWL